MITRTSGLVEAPSSTPATVIMVIVAMVGPPLFVVVPARLLGRMSLAGEVALQCLYGCLVVLVGYVVVRIERLPLRSIGLRRPDRFTFLCAGMVAAVSLFLLPTLTSPLTALLGADGIAAGLRALSERPPWFRVFLGGNRGDR